MDEWGRKASQAARKLVLWGYERRWKVLLLAATTIGFILLINTAIDRVTRTQDADKAQQAAAAERAARAATFWDTLLLAADGELESFVVVCAERSTCHRDLVTLARWSCVLVHFPPPSLAGSVPLERIAAEALTEPLLYLAATSDNGERAWGLFPPDRQQEFAEDILKATSRDFCSGSL